MLELLPDSVSTVVADRFFTDSITEIRMRVDKPLCVATIDETISLEYIVKKQDVDYVLAIATGYSLYAYNDQISDGYIQYDKGIRIGVCGDGVVKNGRLTTVKRISSLCIRNPTQKNVSIQLTKLIRRKDSALIISPPGYGKTTMLRTLIREYAKNNNVLVIDERGELSGNGAFDLGARSDVLLNIPKKIAYSGAVRSMKPDYIATDEIFGESEINAIKDVYRCGVKILASIHANSLENLLENDSYRHIAKYFNYFVVLSGIGKIGGIYDKSEVK